MDSLTAAQMIINNQNSLMLQQTEEIIALRNDLLLLARAVLAAHRCMLPGWTMEICLADQGEVCSHYMGQDAKRCKHYGKCDCPACQCARRYTLKGDRHELD